jgi:hypothetical protein
MSDVNDRIEANLKRLKAASNFNVFGEATVKVPCDDMASYKIEDCQTCPKPCKEIQAIARSNTSE